MRPVRAALMPGLQRDWLVLRCTRRSSAKNKDLSWPWRALPKARSLSRGRRGVTALLGAASQAVDFVRERLRGGMQPRAICEAMCDACLAPDTDGCGKGCDNMSTMVVVLKSFAGPAAAEGAPPVPPPLPPPSPMESGGL